MDKKYRKQNGEYLPTMALLIFGYPFILCFSASLQSVLGDVVVGVTFDGDFHGSHTALYGFLDGF